MPVSSALAGCRMAGGSIRFNGAEYLCNLVVIRSASLPSDMQPNSWFRFLCDAPALQTIDSNVSTTIAIRTHCVTADDVRLHIEPKQGCSAFSSFAKGRLLAI